MILIDSSVWIDYFKNGVASFDLSTLINNDIAITNEVILSELIPLLKHKRQDLAIESLFSLKCVQDDIFWEGIRQLQILNIRNGVNKVGIPDLIIAQQCISNNLTLWTFDKHFKLMAEFTSLKLF